eukprot:3071037-Rhodomonas_salina.1
MFTHVVREERGGGSTERARARRALLADTDSDGTAAGGEGLKEGMTGRAHGASADHAGPSPSHGASLSLSHGGDSNSTEQRPAALPVRHPSYDDGTPSDEGFDEVGVGALVAAPVAAVRATSAPGP